MNTLYFYTDGALSRLKRKRLVFTILTCAVALAGLAACLWLLFTAGTLNAEKNELTVYAVNACAGGAAILLYLNAVVPAKRAVSHFGAVLAGGMFRLGRIPGIDRPALAPMLPNGKGYFLLIDCGANVDCQPPYLVQFGLMGDAYMRGVMGLKEPRVGLVNIGAEAEKGNALVKETYPLMEKAPYHFVGNVEAREITHDQADVIVADGFSGNLILKFMEGMAGTLMGIIKKEMMADTRGKLAGLLAKPAFRRVKKAMDYNEVGGAPLLGVQGAVVKAHGSSGAHAFACAIAQCVKMIDGRVVEIITEGVRAMNAGEAE